MTIYGYARVSTGRQAESGLSLEEQQRQIAAYSEAHRLGAVDSFFVEKGVSGALELSKRLEGIRLLCALKPGDVVISSKLDRMFRSARDALNTVKEFETKRISLHFIDLGGDVSTNGVAKLFFTIMGAVAEFERNRISERQKDAKAQAISEGRYTGGVRKLGYLSLKKKSSLAETDPYEKGCCFRPVDAITSSRTKSNSRLISSAGCC